MIAKKPKRTLYYLTDEEIEKVYYKLNTMNTTPSAYALSKGFHKAIVTEVLRRKKSLTKYVYQAVFKELDCLDNVPESFKE